MVEKGNGMEYVCKRAAVRGRSGSGHVRDELVMRRSDSAHHSNGHVGCTFSASSIDISISRRKSSSS